MYKTVLFNSMGEYSGYKEYSHEQDTLEPNEYSVTDDLWAVKESLTVICGVVVYLEKVNYDLNRKNFLKVFVEVIEEQARQLNFNTSSDIVSYLHDDETIALQKQAKVFIKWRASVWRCFDLLVKDESKLQLNFDEVKSLLKPYKDFLI